MHCLPDLCLTSEPLGIISVDSHLAPIDKYYYCDRLGRATIADIFMLSCLKLILYSYTCKYLVNESTKRQIFSAYLLGEFLSKDSYSNRRPC